MNKPLIFELLDELERNVRLLEALRATAREDFLADPHHYLFAERCFQIAIQCLIDICTYLAAHKGWDRPEDSAAAVLLMGRQGVLPREFAERIVGMANFRNILVHAYLKINRNIVYDMLTRLDDFREFARHILTYVDRADVPEQER